MSARDATAWARALAEFDRLQDLPPEPREVALLALDRGDADLAQRVRGLFSADVEEANTQAPAAEPTPLPAPRVAGYEIHGLLGRGGMGEVYAAERVGSDFVQPVALKRMRLGHQGADVHQRFLRERRILAQLNHPNVARLLDGGLDADGNPYFAMERVDGIPITRYVREHALDARAIVRLFVVVCEAVAYAHRNLIVHRDIKPSNVLVDAEGNVKLLDFGIAKLIDGQHEHATESLAMTPAYAAPEQLLGEAVSTGTDVYSLGLVLFELLTGELPARSWRERLRDATGEADTMERPSVDVLRRSEGDARVRARLAQSLRGDLDQIVLAALRRDPTRRYASAQALADDLRRYLDGRPVHARPDTLLYRSGKFVRRNAFAVTAATVLVFALIAATAVSIGFARNEARARAEAEKQAARATRTRDFLVTLLNDVNPTDAAKGQGKNYTAVQLLQAAAQRVDKNLADAPESQAEIRYALAAGLLQLSDTHAALPLADAAATQLRDLYGEHSLLLADTLTTRAQIREALSDLPGAQADAEAALAATQGLPLDKETRLARLRAHSTLAAVAMQRNDVPKSTKEAEAALAERIAVLGPEDPALAVDYNNIATIYTHMERNADAERAYRRAIEVYGKANGPDHPRMVWLYNGLSFALMGQHKLDEAQRESDRALELANRKLGTDNQILISIYLVRGRVANERGDYARANAEYEAGDALGRALNHPTWASLEIQYGLSKVAQHDYTRAEALFASAAAHAQAMDAGQRGAVELLAVAGRGDALCHLGRCAEGERLARDAVAELAARFPLEKRRIADAQTLLNDLAGATP